MLLDNDFNKPQAFHKTDIARSGGLASIISFLIFVLLNNLLFSILYLDYLVLGMGLFLIGFLDDIKMKFSPKTRLALMTAFLLVCVKIFSIQINGIDLIFLNQMIRKLASPYFVENDLYEYDRLQWATGVTRDDLYKSIKLIEKYYKKAKD